MAVYYLRYAISTLLLLSPFSSSSFSFNLLSHHLHWFNASFPSSNSPRWLTFFDYANCIPQFRTCHFAFNFHQGALAVSHLLIPNHAFLFGRPSHDDALYAFTPPPLRPFASSPLHLFITAFCGEPSKITRFRLQLLSYPNYRLHSRDR